VRQYQKPTRIDSRPIFVDVVDSLDFSGCYLLGLSFPSALGPFPCTPREEVQSISLNYFLSFLRPQETFLNLSFYNPKVIYSPDMHSAIMLVMWKIT